MSTLIVSNVSDGSLSIPTTYVTNGSAKAWSNVNTTVFAVRDSFNVSSVTDVAAGRAQSNFTSAMAANDYSSPVSGYAATGSGGIPYNGVVNQLAASVEVGATTASVYSDTTMLCVSVQGDLA